MQLEFTINWGYQMLYSRRLYHAIFEWDGKLEVSDPNAKMSLALLRYPFCMFGVSYSPVAETINSNEWHNIQTRRSVGGLQVKVDCDDSAQFTLKNKYGDFVFSAQEILQNGFKYFPISFKYDFAVITVSRKGFYWFRDLEENENKFIYTPEKLGGVVEEKRRLLMSKLAAQNSLQLPIAAKKSANSNFLNIQIQGMLLKDLSKNNPCEPYNAQKENMRWVLSSECEEDFVADELTLKIKFSDGAEKKVTHYCRFHDFEVQLLEDIFVEMPLENDIDSIEIFNENEFYDFWITKIVCEKVTCSHLQTELPAWSLVKKENVGRIFSEKECQVVIKGASKVITLNLNIGWNEFNFVFEKEGINLLLEISDGEKVVTAAVGAVYNLASETPPVTVGADLTTVPHDNNGDMERILSYLWQSQMGNTVVFRNFRPYPESPLPDKELLKNWGEYCRKHGIYVQSVNCHEDDSLYQGAKEFMHNFGHHEIAGKIYAGDPDENNPALTMKEASERYIDFIRQDVTKYKKDYCRYGYGDAGGGARYLFMGGLEYIRAETMVPHTQHLCSLVRCASRVFGKGDWGVHIAIQHASQPYIKDWHLGKYFLSLYQAWAMGASNLYEEDSLFTLFKDVQEGWDDCLCIQKRDMTAQFFKFASTHPRKGNLDIRIASLEGRYAAPFNGFICGSEQNPSYSVWGAYGNNSPCWGHGQVEKMRHLLDVLMPGASVLPLRQQEDKRRFFFSGTPYGDFDQLPIEADISFWKDYKLLLNLGWHSANSADMKKICEYVEQGGIYVAGLTEYSQHLGREFLQNMEDLNLWNDGDLSEFCGIRVLGKSLKYSGAYSGVSGDESSSRTYNFSPDEDGDCYLADIELNSAEVIVKDVETDLPLIVKNRYGKGYVYTICAWAYPGHDKLAAVMAVFLRKLFAENRGEVYVEDPSKEVFWNVRNCGHYKLITMLNTDWSMAGNAKKVNLCTPNTQYELNVIERKPLMVYLYKDILVETYGEAHLEISENGEVTAFGEGKITVKIHSCRETVTKLLDFSNSSSQKFVL